jgi:hypothetical protein
MHEKRPEAMVSASATQGPGLRRYLVTIGERVIRGSESLNPFLSGDLLNPRDAVAPRE